MEILFFVVGTISLVVAVPFIADAIRKKDFKDQISGKKEVRKAPETKGIHYDRNTANPAVDQIVQRGIDQIKIDTKSIHL